MNRTIPIINTARVSLRGMRPDEFDRFAEIWADPDVLREIIGGPRNRAECWDAFLRNAGHWQMTGFGQWGVSESASRAMIGQTGFFFRNRGLGDDFDLFPEAGWVFARNSWGKGLAIEAVRAAHDWFDRVMPGQLNALITPQNEASLRIAKKLGYRWFRDAELAGTAVQLLRRNGPL